MATTLALELAAGADLVGVNTATTAADRRAVVPATDLAECLISGFLTTLVDVLEGEGAGSG